MKVLLLNGSTRKNGCTWLALSEIAKALHTEGVETELVQMGGGPVPELVEQDAEGLQTMRKLGRNMAWLLKCFRAGREKGMEAPAAETAHWTNFNR